MTSHSKTKARTNPSSMSQIKIKTDSRTKARKNPSLNLPLIRQDQSQKENPNKMNSKDQSQRESLVKTDSKGTTKASQSLSSRKRVNEQTASRL